MHPDDRVLVAVINRLQDFEIARDQGWYRLPEHKAGRGAFFEYVAFYFTSAFHEQKWAIHYYARSLGHELVTRRELLPDESDHPRAGEPYYKLQLGTLAAHYLHLYHLGSFSGCRGDQRPVCRGR